MRDWFVLIPLGGILLMLPVALAISRAARREMRRIASVGKLCMVCGYDLRATPTQCPECGTTVVGPSMPLTFALDWALLDRSASASRIAVRKPEPNEGIIPLYRAAGNLGPRLLADHLAACGIEARLQCERATSLPLQPSAKVEFWYVMIWSGDADSAVEIVKRFRRGST